MPAVDTPALTCTLKSRSACDNCGIAKVKCDREHSECGRCTILSLTCTYGLSRKCGKPRRKRLGSDLAAAAEKRICTPWTATDCDEATDFREPQHINEPAHANFPSQGADNFQCSFGVDTGVGLNESFDQSLLLDEWLQLDSFGVGMEIPSF